METFGSRDPFCSNRQINGVPFEQVFNVLLKRKFPQCANHQERNSLSESASSSDGASAAGAN